MCSLFVIAIVIGMVIEVVTNRRVLKLYARSRVLADIEARRAGQLESLYNGPLLGDLREGVWVHGISMILVRCS